MLPIRKQTPAEVAAMTFRLTGGKVDPEVTAESYRRGAREMREIAAKAAAAPRGKWRGMTEQEALDIAADQEARAVSVPAELRKLIANASR